MKTIKTWLHLIYVHILRFYNRIKCWYRRTCNYKLLQKKEIMEWEKVKIFSLNYTKKNKEMKYNSYKLVDGVLEYNSDLISQEDILYYICNVIYYITYKVDPIAITRSFYSTYGEEKRKEAFEKGENFEYNEIEMIVDFIYVELSTGKAGEIYQKVIVS